MRANSVLFGFASLSKIQRGVVAFNLCWAFQLTFWSDFCVNIAKRLLTFGVRYDLCTNCNLESQSDTLQTCVYREHFYDGSVIKLRQGTAYSDSLLI